MKNILVVAAHPDDELLGVGGTIRRLADQGCHCRAVILGEGLTSRAEKRSEADFSKLNELKKDACAAAKTVGYESIDFCDMPDNRFDSMDLLDIVKQISFYVEKYQSDTVFTHHHGDLNIDHRRTCEAVLTACRPVREYTVKRIFAFETPSSSEWNYTYTEPFKPTVFYDISDTVDAKVLGMKCYRSESAKAPHPRSEEALRALAAWRGSNVGVKCAEAFMSLREVN
jgi:LmbE family N-acetylglucosaminyl deacetylase